MQHRPKVKQVYTTDTRAHIPEHKRHRLTSTPPSANVTPKEATTEHHDDSSGTTNYSAFLHSVPVLSQGRACQKVQPAVILDHPSNTKKITSKRRGRATARAKASNSTQNTSRHEEGFQTTHPQRAQRRLIKSHSQAASTTNEHTNLSRQNSGELVLFSPYPTRLWTMITFPEGSIYGVS